MQSTSNKLLTPDPYPYAKRSTKWEMHYSVD